MLKFAKILHQNKGVAVLNGAAATVFLVLGPLPASAPDVSKASPDDPVHPGWPAGTPGGLGGKFRPKDGSAREAGEAAINRVALRRAIRTRLTQALSLPLEVAANVIPALGEAADVIMVGQLAATFAEFRQLDVDTKVALDFVANGPYTLDDLRVSRASEAFSSYDEFYKGSPVAEGLDKRFGPAGNGYEYHHIVEQGGPNATAIAAGELHNTENIVRIPTLLHQAINREYGAITSETDGLTLREWLRSQPFSVQREKGVEIMRKLGIVR